VFGDLPLIQGGAAALLGVVVWLILTGRVVPRSTLDLVRATQEVRLVEKQHEADEWKAAAQIRAEQVGTLMKGQSALLEQGATILAFIEALPSKDDS